ncbi:hypothetical protein [Methylobacterium oxalidis]|uniref:hypothetical protein n=1 Tax=Methylobacterium oxalidis TaxID=944322 RepID=UPI003315B437
MVYLVSARSEAFAEWLSLTVKIEDAGSKAANDAAALAKAVEFAGQFANEAKQT